MYEVRQWDDFANASVKYNPMLEKEKEEISSSTDGKSGNIDVTSSEQEKDHPSTWSKKWCSSRSGIKRNAPMQVYTYKVNCFETCTCLIY